MKRGCDCLFCTQILEVCFSSLHMSTVVSYSNKDLLNILIAILQCAFGHPRYVFVNDWQCWSWGEVTEWCNFTRPSARTLHTHKNKHYLFSTPPLFIQPICWHCKISVPYHACMRQIGMIKLCVWDNQEVLFVIYCSLNCFFKYVCAYIYICTHTTRQ